MTENANITEANASTKVILDTRLPVGASPDSTSWQQKGVGEVAQGALNRQPLFMQVAQLSSLRQPQAQEPMFID